MNKVDLSNPVDSLQTFLRMRSDLSGEQDTVSWFGGTIYIVFPGKAPQPILVCDGFGAARVKQTAEHAYDLLVREIMVYKDLATGEILSSWDNPFSEQSNEVVHVQNDPVNFRLNADAGRAFYQWIDLGSDVQAKMDIPMAYPNPLQPDQYPEESSGPMYCGSEHFIFHAKRADIENQSLSSIPCTTSWFRTGPVLPWMKLGQTDAYLLYSSTGKKVEEGFEGLSAQLREYTQTHCPKFATAPSEWSAPNESSWTVYKKHVDAARSK